MENLRLLKFVKQEIQDRENNRDISRIKRMTDIELEELRIKLEEERQTEYKRLGWLQ